jgi:hypothetical protein
LTLLVLGVSLAPVTVASAAGNPAPGGLGIKTMDIHLEPEYDTTDVLVAYDLSFVNGATAPYDGKISFHVPKGIDPAGPTNEVHICEAKGSDKHAYCAPYGTETGQDYLTFSWSPSKPINPGASYPIYVEYYYNPLRVKETQRDIDFFFHPSYDVGQLSLTVMAPLRSSNLVLDPKPQQQGVDGQGFNYSTYRFENLRPEQPVSLKLSYAKADNRPSVAKAGASLGTGSGGTGGGLFKDPSFWFLAILGVGGIGGLLAYGTRAGGRRPGGSRPNRAGSRTRVRPGSDRAASNRGAPSRTAKPDPADSEKQAARRLLLSGKISEATYRQIIDDIERGR